MHIQHEFRCFKLLVVPSVQQPSSLALLPARQEDRAPHAPPLSQAHSAWARKRLDFATFHQNTTCAPSSVFLTLHLGNVVTWRRCASLPPLAQVQQYNRDANDRCSDGRSNAYACFSSSTEVSSRRCACLFRAAECVVARRQRNANFLRER